MLQTFISQIAGRSRGPGSAAFPSTRALRPQSVASGHAGRQLREGWGCGGAALGFQRPRLASPGTLWAQPRRCFPSSAPLPLVSSLSPWVTELRRSRRGPGSYSRPGRCWPPSVSATAPSLPCNPALRAARVPASLGAGARRLLPSPAAWGKQAPWPPALLRADAFLWYRAELQG